MMRLLPQLALAFAAIAVPFAITACGDDAATKTTAVVTAPTTASTGSPTSASSSASAGAKPSASTASSSEIQTALEAAGVPNASRWVREVMEYRPYPADDANLTKLRGELAKYNPGQDVVDKIVAALSP